VFGVGVGGERQKQKGRVLGNRPADKGGGEG
jgi:hypothetical protein